MHRPALHTVVLVVLLLASTMPVHAQDASPAATPADADIEGQFEVADGRQMYLRCRGSGSPTVIIEAGLEDDTSSWRGVQRRIDDTTRICLYDRAGLGQSERIPPENPLRTTAELAADLHTLLTVAGVPGPYGIVAHSAGGLIARQFAIAHPEAVVGLLLIDANSPEYFLEAPVPADLKAAFQGDNIERVDLVASAEGLRGLALPPIPIVLLAAELNTKFDWQAFQQRQAEELGVELEVVPGVMHRMQQQPQLVADMIVAFVAQLRGGSPEATPGAGTPTG